MKKYSVAMVRDRLAEALDHAEAGIPVVIERRGLRYRLMLEPDEPRRARRRASLIDTLDPAVEAGEWSWEWTSDGLTFAPGRSAK
jgi:antitoxin (DNA-binding transcriptional repressor) of toxin-antitoxin stability system